MSNRQGILFLPHNTLPRLLICGSQSPDLSLGNDRAEQLMLFVSQKIDGISEPWTDYFRRFRFSTSKHMVAMNEWLSF